MQTALELWNRATSAALAVTKATSTFLRSTGIEHVSAVQPSRKKPLVSVPTRVQTMGASDSRSRMLRLTLMKSTRGSAQMPWLTYHGMEEGTGHQSEGGSDAIGPVLDWPGSGMIEALPRAQSRPKICQPSVMKMAISITWNMALTNRAVPWTMEP